MGRLRGGGYIKTKSLAKQGILNQGILCPDGCSCANYGAQLSTLISCKGAEMAPVPIFCLVE